MAILLFVLGLLFGSFYLVIALRLPKGEDALFSRSHCDECNHVLKWYNLIPIFSYIFQGGKCSYCKKKISILNLIVELATGILFLVGYLMYGITYEYFMYLIIASLMIIIFVSDFTYLIILDSPLVVALILITILKLIYFDIYTVLVSLCNGLFLFLIMYFVQYMGSKIFKKESLGGGDVKFTFLIGYILDTRLGLVTLILSTFLALPYAVGSIYLTKNHEVPYGPFLVGSLFIVFLFLPKFNALLDLLFSI